MYRFFKIAAITIVFLTSVSISFIANAQTYRGIYTGKQSEAPIADPLTRPIPRVFSSRVVSTQQAERLDVIYDGLYVSLLGYAETIFIYQEKLSAHMQPKKFQLTRYEREFSGDLQDSMADLNNSYNSMKEEIDKAEEKYLLIREAILEEDLKTLDALWNEKIGEFRQKTDEFFKMQHSFLNTYRKLVNFILKQGGSYYYKNGEDRVYFYQFGGYKFFGQSIDKLNNLSYAQRKFLRENTPDSIELQLGSSK